jgi:ATP-dependent helicase IRC3
MTANDPTLIGRVGASGEAVWTPDSTATVARLDTPSHPHAPAPGTSIALRDYQRDAIRAIGAAHAAGRNRLLVVLPTGTGKTVVFADLIRRRPGRALVLAHRDELIQQAVSKLKSAWPGAPVGVVKAERDEHDARVVVASVQTLAYPRRLARLVPDFTTVIVDEAHHAEARSYRRILAHLRAFEPDGPLTVGFTATPERADGRSLAAVWTGGIVYRRDILEMMQAGWLCDLRAVQVRLQVDFNRLHVRGGDFIEGEAADLLRSANVAEHALTAYQRHALGRRTLLFTPTVALAHEMADAFRCAGVSAEALDGATPPTERRGILNRLATGETRVVANCAVLTEGFDLPSTSCIIVARPTRSRPLYIQMVGRGLRPAPDKDDCLILDLAGATGRHDLQGTATLFGLTPAEMSGRTVREAVAHKRAVEAERARQVRDRLPDPAHVRLRMREVSPFGPRLLHLRNPAAPWRREPATARQLRMLRRLRIRIPPGITKGSASDLIDSHFAPRAAGR